MGDEGGGSLIVFWHWLVRVVPLKGL